MDYSANLSGSPLLPPDVLTAYFVGFLAVLVIAYFVIKLKINVPLRQRLKLLLATGLTIKVFVIVAGLLLAAYWLIPTPRVASTFPTRGEVGAPPNGRIEIIFDRPVSRTNLQKSIEPEVPGVWVFENSIYRTHLFRRLVFYPDITLSPNTEYKIKLSNIINSARISDPYDYEYTFKTQESPRVKRVETGEKDIKVYLTTPNDLVSQFDFQLIPETEIEVALDSTKKVYTVTPKQGFSEGTRYRFRIFKTDTIWEKETKEIVYTSTTQEIYSGEFGAGEIATETKVSAKIYPANGQVGVGINNPVKIVFDGEIDEEEVAQGLTIMPEVEGETKWEGNTLVFIPTTSLSYDTLYTVYLDSGISATSTFQTVASTQKLAVPAYLQQHSLSCEVSALRMTLAYRGIKVTEETLLAQVGYDPTPHQGNVWGNPYQAFVGNVDGRQMTTGYGVYWGPIARVARSYRGAQEFEGWSINQLTNEVKNGNPVIIWTYSRNGTPTHWFTPSGQRIYAVAGEHTVVVVGFVGPAENPTKIIVNDSLIGQVYWSRATFDKKWSVFNRSGVVVY